MKSRLTENQQCHHCDFWAVREQQHLNKPFIIVNGCTYSDGGKTSGRSTQYNGFGGAIFKIRMIDSSKEWDTNNLWCGGDIPKKYRTTTMQDNAEFVK
ncbi:hypothetical protein D3C85_681620 [compost metagenome]